ncbi:MAG: DUF692 family multinuclear iron-containing protein [Candidatus Omnitrophota bacterium]
MIKLATPISTFFKDKEAIVALKENSCCFEGRESDFSFAKVDVLLFHFNNDLVHLWGNREKKIISSTINKNENLDLISFHIASCYAKPEIRNEIFYPIGRKSSPKTMLRNAKENIEYLKTVIDKKHICIAAENNNFYPTGAYKYITEPEFINSVIDECNIYLLYDIAHARITSHNKKISYEKYKQKLQLKKMIQLHISKEDIDDKDLAYDAHNLPDKSLCSEVKELVDVYDCRYLTVEYYRNLNKLTRILKSYRKLFQMETAG